MKLTAQATITAADTAARTISGTIAVYGAVGNTSAGPTVIKAGAITVPDKVVMLVSHDSDRPVGLLASHSDDDSQMVGTFSLPLTTSADNALAEAGAGIRDGLSVGLEVDAHEVDADGTLVVTAATLREVSLVTFPAFTAARVSDVAASETPEVSDTTPVTDEPPTESENPAVDDTTPDTVADVTASAALPRITVQDAFPYREGVTASFFRDMLNARHDVQAAQRVHVAQEMMTAAQKTPSVTEIIPPGYRPDMYQGEEVLGQPIASSVSHMSISDATPFKIPVFGSATSLAADHVEGANPTDGTLSFDEITVTPKAVSGKFTASREMLDAANPNLDAIIMKAMAEDYANKVENEAAAALLAAATAGTNAAAGKVSVALLTALATYATTRTLPADRIALGSGYFGKIAAEVDGSGRPLNPYLNPSNADGSISAAVAAVSFAGLAARMAWSTAAKNAIVYRGSDFVLFQSPRLSWRWEEQAGPANIVFAQFGYTAFQAMRSNGALKLTDGTT